MITILYLIVGIALLFFKETVSLTGSRVIKKAKTRWLAGAVFLAAACNILVFDLLPGTIQVVAMGGMPFIIIIFALSLSEKKEASFEATDSGKRSGVQTLVNIIMWWLLFFVLGSVVIGFLYQRGII